MDPNELLAAGTAVAKVAAGSIPFTGIVKRMLGPAADEVAEMWRDQVRLYRYQRQLKCVEKAERMAKEAGFTPQAVPPKILFPLLEGASMEDNEALRDMWAALLANAAQPLRRDAVRPGFIAALKEMAVDEAILLNWVYDYLYPNEAVGIALSGTTLSDAYCELGFDRSHLETCLGGLEASRFLQGHVLSNALDSELGYRSVAAYTLSDRGRDFIEAVRPPKPKE